MLILTMRTDKPEAEVGLFMDSKQLAHQKWQAHRLLAETIHQKLHEVLKAQGKQLADVEGLVIFKGPGSFTGLRIGVSVANALADALDIPIVGETGDEWREKGLQKLQNGSDDGLITPEYGSPPHITQPKH